MTTAGPPQKPARMVQLLYYDIVSLGGKCHRLLASYEGVPIRVSLHPEEDYCPDPGLMCSTHWLLKFPAGLPRWLPACRVTEVVGGRKRRSAWARLRQSADGGCLAVTGCFGRTQQLQPKDHERRLQLRDFCLCLTSRVTEADFQLGYSLTGRLEQRARDSGPWRLTHAALVRRSGY